jgi:hypothetical protein
VLARFEQEVDGLEVFRRGVTVAMDQNRQPLAVSGHFAPVVRRTATAFARTPESAVAVALGSIVSASAPLGNVQASGEKAPYGLFTAEPVQLGGVSYALMEPARAKPVLFPADEGLEPAYYVELSVRPSDGSAARQRSYVISAKSGEVLFDHNQVAYDAYSYRVWADTSGNFTPNANPYGDSYLPHPTGMPDGSLPKTALTPSLVQLANSPFSKNDPWLPPSATEAKGNNVWAFADIATPDGFNTGDVALPPSSAGVFDYSIDPESDPSASDAARQAGITQLFYTVNYMHDSFYDAGYDEKSGNAQLSNYGRGGKEGDPITAEAQDFAGTDNANCFTPSDGSPPRIRMYLWHNPSTLTVLAPAGIAKQYTPGTAAFGPSVFTLTGNLTMVDDGAGASHTDGCDTPFVNAAAVMGNIAVVDRGNCAFVVKAKNAQTAGAVGVLVVNNQPGAAPGMSGTDPTVTIPTMSLSQTDGGAIEAQLTAGTAVQITMNSPHLRDGSFDNTVIAHEWGHSLSHRLISDSNGLNTTQSNGLGEGWSDFVSLLTLVRSQAATAPSNVNWQGTFAVAAFDSQLFPNGYYYGIRRYPYSSDMTKNPLTFKHISNGTALPTSPAPNFGADGSNNAEVHNTGEVWAAMLWDCYTNMLRDTGRYTFAQAQKTMREYLVASLKLTPPDPTLLEARDAVLATMAAHDQKDFAACAASFARRKAGIGAVAPDPNDNTNSGAVESDKLGADIAVVSTKLDDSARSCDNDGIVDNNETGRLSVVIRNTGTSPITDGTMTVTTDNPALLFQSGNVASFPTIQPYQTGTAQIDILVKGATAIFTPTVSVAINASSLAIPHTVSATVVRRMNYDVAPNTSTTETFGVPSKGWSTSGDTSIQGMPVGWSQTTDEMGGGTFAIPDNGVRSDQYLISPAITADPTANLTFTLKHRYSFEADMTSNFDGAIVEISDDGGKTWTDIGSMFTTNGYNGKLTYDNTETPDQRNPLIDPTNPMDRPAFVNQSAGYPAWVTSTADLGTGYAGKSVMLRFRVGTDPATGAPGWELNQLSLTGVTNKPFPTAAMQPDVCQNRAPVVTVTPTSQSVPVGHTATLQGTVSDPDGDQVTYQWVQTGGPMVAITDPTALNQSFTVPPVTENIDATFALRASDGKAQSEATATVTLVASGSGDQGGSGGCGCRAVPVKTRAADGLWDLTWVALAAWYCRRRRARA